MVFTNDGCRQAVTKLFKKDRILLTITLVLIISIFPSAIRASSPQRVASLTLDGSSLGSCPSVTSSCSATINPQSAGDLIMVFAIESLNQQASPCGFSVSDTANLAWTPRSSIVFDQTGKSEMQEFWAESISLLASETVTETITGCGNNYNTILVFAISGVNLSHPFDPNTSLPGSANGNSGDTSVQVSTTNSNDILFAGLMHGSLTTPTTGPGFTFITTPAPDTSEYEVVSSPMTNMGSYVW